LAHELNAKVYTPACRAKNNGGQIFNDESNLYDAGHTDRLHFGSGNEVDFGNVVGLLNIM
jgi:hypothetical protein